LAGGSVVFDKEALASTPQDQDQDQDSSEAFKKAPSALIKKEALDQLQHVALKQDSEKKWREATVGFGITSKMIKFKRRVEGMTIHLT